MPQVDAQQGEPGMIQGSLNCYRENIRRTLQQRVHLHEHLNSQTANMIRLFPMQGDQVEHVYKR